MSIGEMSNGGFDTLEADRFVSAQTLQTVKGVHEQAHQESPQPEVFQAADHAQEAVFEGKGFPPELSMGR